MKHKYTDEEIQTAIDTACQEVAEAHPYTSQLLTLENYRGSNYDREAHARLDLLKSALDKLPEPQPPTASGKTPGEFYNELARSEESNRFMKWSDFTEEDRASENKRLYAVIDAFSGAGLEQAIAMMEAVPLEELSRIWRVNSQTHHEDLKAIRARLIAAAREGQPTTVDWKARHDGLQKAYAGHADVTAALHDKVQKAEAELALMTLDYDKCRKERGELLNQRDQLLARPQLSTLRPIAEAGEVPAGCVRLTGARNDDGTWELAEAPATSFDTHCADFYLPDEAKTPAAETFEAHGKTWNSHTPRTDAVVKGEWLQYEKLARQLERELNAAKSVLTQIYNDTEGYADGAPDASSHDKLCNEISSICKPFVTTP